MRLVNRINYFYIDLYINIETRELEGHQLSALPLQWLHSGTSVGGIRWQWLSASPQMNLTVVILPSTDWKSLSQRHCRVYRQSNGTETTPFSRPALPSSCQSRQRPATCTVQTGGLQSGAEALGLGTAGGGTLLDQGRFGGFFLLVLSSNSLYS